MGQKARTLIADLRAENDTMHKLNSKLAQDNYDLRRHQHGDAALELRKHAFAAAVKDSRQTVDRHVADAEAVYQWLKTGERKTISD